MTANQTQNLPTRSKVDVLKNMLNADSVFEQFKNALGENSGMFVASLIDLYNGDSNLQLCEPKAVIAEALKAAAIKLPINKALGQAFIVSYKGIPTFQIGYKGIIQLALRSNQYRNINADVVYEGELRKVDKLTGEIAFDGEKKSDKIVGYFCHFELLNGFRKTLYMSVENMAKYAKKYAPSIPKDVSVERLIALANVDASKSVGWVGNFTSMAIKTVIRSLISKYGYMSIDMQRAFDEEDNEYRIPTQQSQRETTSINVEDAKFEDVSQQGDQSTVQQNTTQQQAGNIPDPGY
jgi:recombination protein RecT